MQPDELGFFFCIVLRQLAHGCRELLIDAEAVLLTKVDDSLDMSVVVSPRWGLLLPAVASCVSTARACHAAISSACGLACHACMGTLPPLP